ncbi:ATP-binding cassette domain-containing protein [Nonomuraea ferruginea]
MTGLGVRRRRAWALRDCSLSVPAGRVAALVGPNGAGKTTLMLAAVGLLTPDRGHISVRGDRRVRGPGQAAVRVVHRRRAAGVRAADEHPLGRRGRAGPAGRAGRPPLGRRAGRLSGGQQAQVAITLALARTPDLLVLDEPLANLDPLARHDVMRTLMGEVAGRGLTVLLSSHVIADLEDTCDWLVVLNGGLAPGQRRHRRPARSTICCCPARRRRPKGWRPSPRPAPAGTPPCWSAATARSTRAGAPAAPTWTNWSWATCAALRRRRCPALRGWRDDLGHLAPAPGAAPDHRRLPGRARAAAARLRDRGPELCVRLLP